MQRISNATKLAMRTGPAGQGRTLALWLWASALDLTVCISPVSGG